MQLIDDGRGVTKPAARAPRSDEAAIYLEGVVVEGQQLARNLGFPTANVELDAPQPRFGSYAAWTRLADGRVIPGVANVGRNPTTGLVKPRLESTRISTARPSAPSSSRFCGRNRNSTICYRWWFRFWRMPNKRGCC
jgi:hypothetical protein